jgi:hypothetical protein
VRRSHSIAFKEEDMARRKRARADAEAGSASTNLASAVTQSAGAWLEGQAELLHEVNAMTQAWLQRRRETIAEMRQSIEEMRNSRELADLLRIQQEWLTGSLRRVASDFEAWATLGSNMWQRSMLRFTEAGQSAAHDVRRTSDSAVSGSSEAMLSTAGSKPRGQRARQVAEARDGD